jgi:DNA repair protein RecO (recombination protein O)
MHLIRDQAVVLARFDYSETSQVLVLLTRDCGKVRVLAKGIKRGTKNRFSAGADVLDVGEVVLSARRESGGLSSLTEWKQIRSLTGIREALPRLHAARYVAEITMQLTEDWDAHPGLFDSLLSHLVQVAGADEPLCILVRYQIDLLTAIGSIPRLEACVACGRESDLTHFSSFDGGLICRHCEAPRVEKRAVPSATLRGFRGDPDGEAVRGAFCLLNYHLTHLMGKEPAWAAKLVPVEEARRT